DAHESFDRQTEFATAEFDEGIDRARRDAGLLRLLAGIDLDEAGGPALLLAHREDERAGELLAVEAFDEVEERDRFRGVAGLEGSDQVQADVRTKPAQRRPFASGLLDAVLAEDPVAGREHRLDLGSTLGLGDGDELDGSGIAPGRARRGGNAGLD